MKPGYCQRPIPESGSTPSCADAVQAMAKASRARRAMPLQPSKRQLEAKPSCELNKDWAGRKADTPARIADSPASEGRPKTSAPAEAPKELSGMRNGRKEGAAFQKAFDWGSRTQTGLLRQFHGSLGRQPLNINVAGDGE